MQSLMEFAHRKRAKALAEGTQKQPEDKTGDVVDTNNVKNSDSIDNGDDPGAQPAKDVGVISEHFAACKRRRMAEGTTWDRVLVQDNVSYYMNHGLATVEISKDADKPGIVIGKDGNKYRVGLVGEDPKTFASLDTALDAVTQAVGGLPNPVFTALMDYMLELKEEEGNEVTDVSPDVTDAISAGDADDFAGRLNQDDIEDLTKTVKESNKNLLKKAFREACKVKKECGDTPEEKLAPEVASDLAEKVLAKLRKEAEDKGDDNYTPSDEEIEKELDEALAAWKKSKSK